MEGNSFLAPGHLPLKWNYYGPLGHNPFGFQPPKEASWMTPEIRTELQHRNRLQAESRKTGSPKDCQEYQAQCEKVQIMIDQSKSSLGLRTEYNSGYGQHTGPNSDGQGFGSGPPDYQHPSHFQGTPVGNQRAAYYHNSSNYYSQINKRKLLSCGPCNRTFYNKQRLDEHLKEHVECPFPECRLSAHIKVIDQHINNQHMLVNFANLQIDDETWITERKKRFPTTHRAELRRAEQMEKLKRGEKLGRNKNRFNKDKGKYNQIKTVGNGEFKNSTNKDNQKEAGKDNSKVNAHDESKGDRGKIRHKKLRKRDKPVYPSKAFVEVDLYDSDEDFRDGFPAFRGTKQFYESTGEVSYFGNKTLDIEDPDDDIEIVNGADIIISDDEEWQPAAKDEDTSSGKLVLGGALGSLMDAYSDSDEENKDLQVLGQNNEKLESLSSDSILYDPSQNVNKIKDQDENKQTSTQNTNTTIRRKTRRQPRGHKAGKRPVVRRTYRFPKRRRTLLEKLLQPDIVHERNIILQCVRFIVKNNFFDDGIDNSECVEEKDVNEIKVASEQGVTGEKMESVTDAREMGETFGEIGIKEVISKEDTTERVEEIEMNIDKIREESDRIEDLAKDAKSMDNNITAIRRNNASSGNTEDDCGYESDKEV